MSAISRKVLSAFFLLSSVLLATSGCQKKEQAAVAAPPAATPVPTAEPVSVVPTAAPAPPTAAPASSAAPAAAPGAPASSAVASTEGEKPGIRVEVTELKRSPSALSLKFTIVNDSDKQMGFGYDFADSEYQIRDHATVGGVSLLDAAGRKKYMVVRDSENRCVCSRDLKDLAAGSRLNLWAKFPPPPEDVKRISIVIPHFAPMDDVPISQ